MLGPTVLPLISLLDDAELARLGAPWHKYLAAAHKAGVSVARLPIPEGHPPSTYHPLDSLLSLLLSHLSLGYNVLTHCRGGVGRAAVIACCLFLRMGLVKGKTGWERGRRAVAAVRCRRGMRSVETAVQEEFVEGYWDWREKKLAQGRMGSSVRTEDKVAAPNVKIAVEESESRTNDGVLNVRGDSASLQEEARVVAVMNTVEPAAQ
ncbi:hypothetical protein HDU93_003036 [Gonapodya sp. JEL0774]|nr:hypothetical protein HDU93_003036 [Gonapodya sp. JEL0774]